MTRIIAGAAGSLTLDVPKAGTRPTSDRVREALFSSLEAWGMLEGVKVLDLYAGSGALGFEAVSRGAVELDLVEKHGPAAQIVARNATKIQASLRGSSPRIDVHRQAAANYLSGCAEVPMWDVVFIDPPYDLGEAELVENLEAVALRLRPQALIMVERSSRSPEPAWPAGIVLFKKKSYGETAVWWAESAESAAANAADDANTDSGSEGSEPAE
ncbi:16S rRNA (guanine(966)-N(2))-methyltransferase RsmD [Leucobacter sp. cx-42]|uniref:16S rRNA (guanine(966)-N(2))-methyltransferase RsmD n=1 Tax=unclassified Leucobacter TaxID=2621730 RepID=UPI00165E5304|nr:16S rRNA (guanine(966)-N(2))-methyltransferase RsmD [Leucobacter sp. cx-42]